jgi:PII-like signaling protein
MTDALKLTTYHGERQRTGGAFVADALLALYGRHEVQTSILLRGAEGFGLRHHLRTDRLLTLSDDLPVVSIAVDRRARIEALLADAAALERPGLVTIERARLVAGDLAADALPGDLAEETKLTVYLGRQESVGRAPAFVAVCDLLHRRGIAGATAFLGVDGTAHGARRRARFLHGNPDVPMMVVAVGAGDRIAAVLPELGAMLRRPLVTLERVQVCKRDGVLLGPPRPVPADVQAERGAETWQKLMVYCSEHTRFEGVPIHVALVRRLRASGARGATVLRGMWGFHGDHLPHGDRLLQVRRRVPVVTVVLDTPDAIARAFAIVDVVTRERGLVTCEVVPAVGAGGQPSARPYWRS